MVGGYELWYEGIQCWLLYSEQFQETYVYNRLRRLGFKAKDAAIMAIGE